MKLWKKILIILLIVVAIFVIFTLRKMFILISLDNKVSKLENTKNNIYEKVISERDDIYKSNVSEIYIKDEINKSINTLFFVSLKYLIFYILTYKLLFVIIFRLFILYFYFFHFPKYYKKFSQVAFI